MRDTPSRKGVFGAVYIHPLGPLDKDEFLAGIGQVVNLATTYGSDVQLWTAQFRRRRQQCAEPTTDRGSAARRARRSEVPSVGRVVHWHPDRWSRPGCRRATSAWDQRQ